MKIRFIFQTGSAGTGSSSIQMSLNKNKRFMHQLGINYSTIPAYHQNILEMAILPQEKWHRINRRLYFDNPDKGLLDAMTLVGTILENAEKIMLASFAQNIFSPYQLTKFVIFCCSLVVHLARPK